MKRVGILVGRETTFPTAMIESLNKAGKGKIQAELVKIGGIRLDEPKKYDVIIDRISHEVPFYRATLKRFALEGTYIINNPFWWSADDKFFNFSLASKIGIAIPKTVLLPQHSYIEDINSDSLRNLEFPIDWQAVIDYTGLPSFLKPFDGGGWKNVSKIESLEQLWYEYNQTGRLCMTLQEGIDFEQFVRCYCVGKEEVLVMPYDPSKPYLSGEQYVPDPNYLEPKLLKRVEKDVRTICDALGYDLNTVEFAIRDGIPYAIDFMNPAPDAELASVGEYNHLWIIDALTSFIVEKLEKGFDKPKYRWDSMLDSKPVRKKTTRKAVAKKPAAKKATAKKAPAKKVRSKGTSGK